MEIVHQYTRLRRDFGRQPLFCVAGPELCDSIALALPEHRHYMLRNPVHRALQHGPCFARHDANTFRAEMHNQGANHAEGGWPKDINTADPEATQRYRRKVEKDDGYIACVENCAKDLEHYIDQNNAIDMYNIYFKELAASARRRGAAGRTVNVYRVPPPAQPVSSLVWQPEGEHHFAATYLDVSCERQVRPPYYSYIWDVNNSNEPLLRLQPPCPLVDLQYNPRAPTTLAAGLMTGQVGAFDRRAGPLLQATCPPHVAHRDLVRRLMFINAKSGQEFFSAGPDGVCKWWDLRALSEPTDEMIIDAVRGTEEPSQARALGVSALEFEPTIPTRFMVGSENGLVLGGNRKGKTAAEKLPASFAAHSGPVYVVERNPGFLKTFLTLGDWTARVWSEECRESAVLWSPPQRHRINGGCWSPTRSSLVVLASSAGCVTLWDLLRRQHEPVLSMQLCEEPLLRVAPHETGQLYTLGSQKGNIFLVELDTEMTFIDKQEKQCLNAIFERESKRERILEARLREIKLRLKQEAENAAGGGGSPRAERSLAELEGAVGDRDLAEATAEYFQTVKKEFTYFT